MNRCGSFVVGFDASDDAYLEQYYELGKKNGVPGIAILSGDEARAIDPAVNHDVVKALWTPSAAYVEPYEVVEALMENAIDNGAELMLNTEVLGFTRQGAHLNGVVTDKGIIEADCVPIKKITGSYRKRPVILTWEPGTIRYAWIITASTTATIPCATP